MAGVNLITKYKETMERGFARDSYTLNKVATDWTFDGAKSIKIKSYVMDDSQEGWSAVGTAPRAGGNRFGVVTDIEDVVQTLTLGKTTFWTKTLDESDKAQGSLHQAAEYMKQHNNEVDMPKRDKHNLRQWALHAGQIRVASAALSKTNIIEEILDLEAAFDEKNVPQDGRWVYCPISYRKFIRLSDEWDGDDSIDRDMILKGYQGKIGSLKFVFVPTSYMPADVEMLACYQGSVIAPLVYKLARILDEQQGFAGPVLEYLDLFDAFVKGIKQDGVIALLKYGTTKRATKPTVGTVTSGAVPLTSSGSTIYYTLDGSDPRWSDTTATTASGGTVDVTGFTGTMRVIARNETVGSEKYTSEETTQAFTNGAKS